MDKVKDLCIYHSNCADGFGAAFAVRNALGGHIVDFYPGVHGNEPPDVTGRNVIIVDFSYKRDVLIDMAGKAEHILVIDHHKSAEADLVDLPDNVEAVFDMTKSGAVMAWEYFNSSDIPPLLLHIQDNDLWKFEIEGTREIQAAVFSYPYDFEVWDRLMTMPDALDVLRMEGAAIFRKHMKDINEFICIALDYQVIAGYKVPVLNAPYIWSSEAGHIMCKGHPFAACYWSTPKGTVFSLRSDDDGIDVSVISSLFGGGGHEHAAGFTLAAEDMHKLSMPEYIKAD